MLDIPEMTTKNMIMTDNINRKWIESKKTKYQHHSVQNLYLYFKKRHSKQNTGNSKLFQLFLEKGVKNHEKKM